MSGQEPKQNWKAMMDRYLSKMELIGVKGANMVHRGFINGVLLFICWNMYSFAVNYNNYWRLRRDPNLPRQWLEEQTRPGEGDYDIERERQAREIRLKQSEEQQARAKQFYM